MPARSPKRSVTPRGFTLLEVLVAVAILGLSLSSLLSSQIAAMRATQYARGISSAALLAEYQLIEIEYLSNRDGWVDSDVDYRGDFDEQGWDESRYECTVHFIELPEYNQLVDAKSDADREEEGQGAYIQDAGDQAFSALGPVWGLLKNAIEKTIRKASCTVYWKNGEDSELEYDFSVETFWVHPEGLQDLPGLGGEVGDVPKSNNGPPGSTPPRGGSAPKSNNSGNRGRPSGVNPGVNFGGGAAGGPR